MGADRIVNSVAAFEKFGGPCIIVDFGTATTFDVVSHKGEYLGGVITPGIGISAGRAVCAHRPPATRGHSQAPARAGDQHRQQRAVGSVLRIPGIDRRHSRALIAELGDDVTVVATGGLASLMGGGSKYIREIDDLLTLDGLRIIYERNLTHARRRADSASGNSENAEPSAAPDVVSGTPKRD